MRLFWDGFSGYTRTSVIIISPLRSVDPPQIEFPLYNCHCRLDDITFFQFYFCFHSALLCYYLCYCLLPSGKEEGEKERRKGKKNTQRLRDERTRRLFSLIRYTT